MTWNDCIWHILLVIAALLTWSIAGLSAAVYLLRYRRGSAIDDSGANDDKHLYRQSQRNKLTLIYLVAGLIFWSGGIVMGYLDAGVFWRSNPLLEFKVIFTILIWLYYLGILGAGVVLRLKKYAGRGRLVSILALVGSALLLVNIVISRYSMLHDYL